jgi:hypothetical protein
VFSDWLTFHLEFAGTLVGFDDYVSMLSPRPLLGNIRILTPSADMVLEDVIEL